MLTATPYPLRSGAWGAKVAGSVHEGDTITIRAKSGKSWPARVAKVVTTFSDGVSLVATESLDRTPVRSSRLRRSGAGSAAPVRGYSDYCSGYPDCGCYDCAS